MRQRRKVKLEYCDSIKEDNSYFKYSDLTIITKVFDDSSKISSHYGLQVISLNILLIVHCSQGLTVAFLFKVNFYLESQFSWHQIFFQFRVTKPPFEIPF